MVKSELVEKVAEKLDIAHIRAQRQIDAFLDIIIESLASGERVEIRGFGAFTVRDYKAYEGRNPQNGKIVQVAEKKLPFWKTSSVSFLKKAENE